MKASENLIRDIILAADGEIVGRVRLQKILYLLNVRGLGVADAEFHYHHYGPYSRVFDEALERAKALLGVTEHVKSRVVDGAPFSIFRVESGGHQPAKIGKLKETDVKRLVGLMKKRTSTILELAATIYWLVASEKVVDWQAELVRRKGAKAEGNRINEAINLLNELELKLPKAA